MSGHEHLNGSTVVLFFAVGQGGTDSRRGPIVGAYGRKLLDNLA